jgi:hypothetical protein
VFSVTIKAIFTKLQNFTDFLIRKKTFSMTAQNYLAIIYLQKEQILYFCCCCDFSAAAEVLEQQQQQTTHGPAAGGRLAAAHLPAAG